MKRFLPENQSQKLVLILGVSSFRKYKCPTPKHHWFPALPVLLPALSHLLLLIEYFRGGVFDLLCFSVWNADSCG